jgi:NAD(P)-dependent dehydrogenase (short-subunit alcohol dehydrogenase family)
MSADGASVAITGRTADRLVETQRLASDGIGRILPLAGDTSDESTVADAFDRCVEAFGRLDVLVNNAAIAGPISPIWETDLPGWTEALTTNLTGPWLCCRAAARVMIAQRNGRIVNIGSITGKRPLANRTPYATTKLGLVGLTKTLAVELGPYGITVNVVSPGAIATTRLDDLAQRQGRPLDDLLAEYSSLTTLGRIGVPEDVAEAVAFLASDRARNITGIDLSVDAGLSFS